MLQAQIRQIKSVLIIVKLSDELKLAENSMKTLTVMNIMCFDSSYC